MAVRARKDTTLAIILLAPTIYILFKVFIVPIFQSTVWSFYKYNLMDGSAIEPVGLRNYAETFQLHDFWVSMGNTAYFTVFSVGFELILGFFSAMVLNHMFKGRIFFRGMIIVPWAMLTLVSGLLWNWIYQPGYGALSVVLHDLHVLAPDSNPLWLSSSLKVVTFAAIADIWKMTPFMTLLLLAAMQSIPASLYEAAVMDGAGFWKKITHITIPQLLPAAIVAVVLRIIGAYRVYDILTVFTGDPKTSISYLTFNYSFRYFYLGKASAMAWVSTLFILILIIIYIMLLKKNQDMEA
ncbi:sugar ABC transporter permease [Paenibacillus sp. SYP-B3998]|uniref:ABC transporter permease subunit n=1 Tax=Paenibacillus sp. SYP-B3998 TaxID=2678564 RepID=UPI0013D49F2D